MQLPLKPAVKNGNIFFNFHSVISLLLKLAVRNVLRNKTRTILSGTAFGVGVASLIFFDALMVGMSDIMIRSGTGIFPGNAQIHMTGFQDTLEVEKTIAGGSEILAKLANEELLDGYSPRTMSYGMISSSQDVGSVMVYGIDPELEKKVSKLEPAIEKGKYLEKGDDRKILIGKQTAANLGAELGDRVVITMAQAGSGDLSQEMFRVGGIFSFGLRELDSGTAFINLSKAQSLLKIDNRFHEIALNFKDIRDAGNNDLPFFATYSSNGNEAIGWRKLFSELDAMLQMTDSSMLIFAMVLFGIVAFGIMNTLFMSLYERTFEFGVLRAVGTRQSWISLLVVFETCILGAISNLIGVILALAFTIVFSYIGIDYTGMEFAGVTFQELLYPRFEWLPYLKYPLWLFVFSTLVGLIPAIFAAMMRPAKALRKSF